MAVELDTTGNGAIDIERGGTNATTALQAISNLGGQPADADLDTISTGTFAQKRALIQASAKPVSGIANLRLTSADFSGDTRYLSYHTSIGDGGQGIFIWDAASVLVDNNGTIIQVTGHVGAGLWIRQYTGPVSAKWFGLKADGVSDDYTVAQYIVDNYQDVIWPSGTILLSNTLEVSKYPFKWRGTLNGYVNVGSGNTIQTIFKAVGSQTEIVSFKKAASNYTSFNSQISDMTFASDNGTSNQHAFLIAEAMGFFNLQRVTFQYITGYGIAFDAANIASGAMQSVKMSDISFLAVGGAIGFNGAPANSRDLIAISLFDMSNINVDGAINAVSPQPYLFDFRGVRHINVSNIVTEGVNATGGFDTIIALASNGWLNINGWHSEWSPAGPIPTYLVKMYADTGNKWYSDSSCSIHLNNLNDMNTAKLAAETGTEPKFSIRGWNAYYATAVSDIIEYVATTANAGPSFTIDELEAALPFIVPEDQRGYVKINSYRSAVKGGVSTIGPTKLFSWRPSMGSLNGFSNAYVDLSMVVSSFSSTAIEADTTNARIQVERYTAAALYQNFPRLKIAPAMESSWLGSTVTIVIRYYAEIDAADSASTFTMAYPTNTRSGTDTFINTNVRNAWTTGVFTVEPSTVAPDILSRALTAFSVPVILRIAAIDVFLGSDWTEPLDLDTP